MSKSTLKVYKHVFVSVLYKNTSDIEYLLQSIDKNIEDYKVILVNSYYDEESKNVFMAIAKKYSCDFINIENKGYGYGNNQGIKYAIDHYGFEYLSITNPDIIVENFLIKQNDPNVAFLLCPVIHTLNNRDQNPLWVIKNSFSEWLMYIGHKHNKMIIAFSGIAINKIIREVFLRWVLISNKRMFKVYAAHGSFVVFSRGILRDIGLPFDENMFLFCEEMYLARRLRSKKIKTFMTKDIKILHKEDGSMGVANVNILAESRKSYLYYYRIRKLIDRTK